ETCEPDLLGRNTKLCFAVGSLAFFDRFPTLFDWREIPTLALPAHDPQPSLGRVECQPSPDGKVLDGFVGAERGVTEEAGRVHRI
ncbi:MAG TPA: hypothetical protein VK481_09245, partial [Gemmatimonadaceae bacterium]|nr:hypothetical protein [Gemmatimonadaceae bacterium]